MVMEDKRISNVMNGGRKIRSSSSPTSYISRLSDELLIEILCRLDSSKNATRCKSVCKRWFLIIKTSSLYHTYFMRRWQKIHLNKEKEEDEELAIVLLTQYRDSPCPAFRGLTSYEIRDVIDYSYMSQRQNLLSFNTFDFLPLKTQIYIHATHKDLVVCSPGKTDHSVYYLCNPFTKQWIVLPPPPPLPKYYSKVKFKLFFFCEEGKAFKFKLVRIIPYIKTLRLAFYSGLARPKPNNERFKVDIFSSEDRLGTWNEMVNVPECLYSSDVKMLVWLNSSELFCFSSSEEIVGLKFSHSNTYVNSYIRFSLPSGYQSQIPDFLLGVCRGCLRLAQVVRVVPDTSNSIRNNTEEFGQKLIIWELNRHGRTWDLVHELDFSEVQDSSRGPYQIGKLKTSVLAFDPNDGDIVYLCWFCDKTSYIFLCDVRRRTLELIREISVPLDSCDAFPLLQPFWPTRVPRFASTHIIKRRTSFVHKL